MARNSILFIPFILFILLNFSCQSYELSKLHNNILQFGFTAPSLRSLAVAPNLASQRVIERKHPDSQAAIGVSCVN